MAKGEHPANSGTLLAVDLGVRSGFALYSAEGRLLTCRSQNFGDLPRLRRAIPGLLQREAPHLQAVALEGPTQLAKPWLAAAERRELQTLHLSAERWRQRLLLPREQRAGADAKRRAGDLALRVISWSGAPRPPVALTHDAAEAVLVGLWAVLEFGWLPALPRELR